MPEFTPPESGTSVVSPLRAALGEFDTGWHDPDTSVRRAHDVIAGGARLRARLVVLPEMCSTGFFTYAGEHEVYAQGDSPVVVNIEGARVGLFICFDLRFPELFRAVAPDVDAILLIANWPERRRLHWDVLTRARAIENQCYVVAVNRTGVGDGVEYDGGSVAYDPWGEPLGIGGGVNAPRVVDIDPARVKLVRARYPFLRELENARDTQVPLFQS